MTDIDVQADLRFCCSHMSWTGTCFLMAWLICQVFYATIACLYIDRRKDICRSQTTFVWLVTHFRPNCFALEPARNRTPRELQSVEGNCCKLKLFYFGFTVRLDYFESRQRGSWKSPRHLQEEHGCFTWTVVRKGSEPIRLQVQWWQKTMTLRRLSRRQCMFSWQNLG